MRAFLRSLVLAVTLVGSLSSAEARRAVSAPKGRTEAQVEDATRLQVFLDRAQFAPGKIDGHYGEFTVKALALYRRAQGAPAAPAGRPAVKEKHSGKPSPETTPDVTGLDLASVNPVFVEYTVTEADLQSVGEMPSSVPAQAKQKSLPYATVAEAVAERFHMDPRFLEELNAGKTKALKPGTTLRVPNVEPFELAAVKDLKPGQELAGGGANELDEETGSKKGGHAGGKKEKTPEPPAPTTAVKVDVKTNMLTVYEGEKLIAAYPVTIGSAQTVSPIGEWKVRGVAKMPNFRYDKAMLNHGKRSSDFHMLPPGPNNPVGVIWIALNKKGIGLHGTNDPDSIGRSASHGCVRLANWDVVRLAGKVQAGVAVSIR